MALFPSGRAWQNRPGSCCHPKIAADLEAGREPSDTPKLFTLLHCVCTVKVTHDPLGTTVHRWQTTSRQCHKAAGTLVEYLLHLTTLTSNLKPRVNWECQEKDTCGKSRSGPFMLSWTLWKLFDNKAALSWILSHVMDECFHHFQMDISAAAVPQVPTKVFTLSLSLDKKLFHVVVQLLTEPPRGGGGEFVRLTKMPFWPTYNFVRSALSLPVAAPGWHRI